MVQTVKGKVLIVDDDADVLLAGQMLLERYHFDVEIEPDPESLPEHLSKDRFDVILLDMNFTRDASSGREGIHWLQKIRQKSPETLVITITAYGDVHTAVQAMKEGATDFVEKPWNNERLVATVSSAVKLRASRRELKKLESKQAQLTSDTERPYAGIIGSSPSMAKVFEVISKVGPTHANVLITGENGSGKELVARELHRRSLRSSETFVPIDLGAISETLFDSELFGHVKGSFTDAKTERIGRFEAASGGTLFLDEIGNLSVSLQQKLLTAIQSQEITRLGSNKRIQIDTRLICATNMPLAEMIEDKTFRQDLYYRINTVEIHLPPLRERIEDLPLLLDHFTKIYAAKYNKPVHRISSGTLQSLAGYHWPGNIRELQHAVERAIIMSDGDSLEMENFFLASPPSSEKSSLSVEDYNLESVEQSVIERVLRIRQGNISHAAKDLGLTRASLYRRMEKYGL